ncbi:hypothetical protein TSAR_004227 [Trichomalopsis sarcophagae]|uniref:Uncharacterized protein n=1 Tax=Trichomalopsis sarcophagae TaxID=543379 RepID=A0A232EQ90_9HYME|nr:hypothetical protein TSAR_004227 [Trichomalopsis sarcophagae]
MHPDNPYLFGTIGSDTNLNMLNNMQPNYPERLRGTLFRKNISTLCLSLKLTDNRKTDLYQCLGHSATINKNVYAQNSDDEDESNGDQVTYNECTTADVPGNVNVTYGKPSTSGTKAKSALQNEGSEETHTVFNCDVAKTQETNLLCRLLSPESATLLFIKSFRPR